MEAFTGSCGFLRRDVSSDPLGQALFEPPDPPFGKGGLCVSLGSDPGSSQTGSLLKHCCDTSLFFMGGVEVRSGRAFSRGEKVFFYLFPLCVSRILLGSLFCFLRGPSFDPSLFHGFRIA